MPVYTPVKHMPRHRYPYQTRERVRKGIGLSKLLLNSSRMVDMHNSMYVKPFKVEKLRDLQGRTVFRAYTHTNDPRFPPERDHSPTIRPKDVNYKGKISNCPSVVLSCTCYRWVFLWEYADALRGDGLIWYGNGEPPLVTNPSYYPALCIAKGELVLTLRGNTPIEQVTTNDKVWTLDGWKQVLAAACTGFKDTITLKTNSGRSLTLTQEHEVYASLSGNPFSWIEAGNITTDHSLCFSIPLVLSQDNAQEYSVPDRVVEIIKNDEGSDVYDLTVEDAEHFTANGFVVHNCKHLISFSRWLKARGL